MVRVLLIVALVEGALIAWLLAGRAATSDPVDPAGASSPTETIEAGAMTGRSESDDVAPGAERTTDDASAPTEEAATAAKGRAASPADRNPSGAATQPDEDAPGIIHGKIAFSDGREVTRWHFIWLFAEGKEAIPLSPRKDGTFAGAGIPPGVYEARAATWAARGMSKTIELKPGGRISTDFAYESFEATPVHILDPSGKSIFEVLRDGDRGAWRWIEYDFAVIATRGPPTRRPPATLGTDFGDLGVGRYAGQGEYSDKENDDGREGTLYVPDGWPLHVSLCLRSEILATQQLAERPESITFRLSEEQFEALLSGVTFTLTGDAPASELEDGHIVLQHHFLDAVEYKAFERKGNRITIRDQLPGLYNLSLFFGGELEDYHQYVDLPAGEILDLGAIHLRKATQDKIRFLDADGAPVAGASVHVKDVARPMAEQPTELGRNTDADGVLLFTHGPGRYYLEINASDGNTTYGTEIEVPLPKGKVHEIRLPRAYAANIRMMEDLSGPVEIAIFAGPGRVVERHTHTPPRIFVSRFGEGSYTAVATEGDGTVHRVPFEVGPDFVPTITIEKGAKK